MADQAFNLRKHAWEANRNAHYVTVSSGKGGVGKSNFSVNLAYQLANLGKRVLLFDADLGLANIDIMLSVTVSATIKKYIEDKATIDEIIKKDVYGFDILPASTGFMELTTLTDAEFEKIFNIFLVLDSRYDYVIFDTGAGISDAVTRFSSIADSVIVVTNPEPTAITDAYAFMKIVSKLYNIHKMFIVFNKVDDLKSADITYNNLKTVVSRFLSIDLQLLNHIREDKLVRKAVRLQKPVSVLDPNSFYARDIENCVRSFIGLPSVKKTNEKVYTLFKSVFR